MLFYMFLKQKKVMFWDAPRRFAESVLSVAKTRFLGGIPVFSRIPHFLGKKCTFPVPGLQNTSQNLVFMKGFTRGARKSPFGAKRCTLGPRNILFGNWLLLAPMADKSFGHLLLLLEPLVFYKEYQWFAMVENDGIS